MGLGKEVSCNNQSSSGTYISLEWRLTISLCSNCQATVLVELVRARNFDTYAKNGSVLLLFYNSQLFVSKSFFFFFFARSFIQKFSKKSTKFILLRALLLIKFWTSQQKFYCLSGKSVPVLNHSNCAYFFSLYWVAISSSATCIYCFLSRCCAHLSRV